MVEGTVHTGSPAKFSTKPTEEWKKFRIGWWIHMTPSHWFWLIVKSNVYEHQALMKFDWNYSVIIGANAFQNADWKYQPFCTGLNVLNKNLWEHYNDVIMTTIASQITSLAVVYSTVYSDADQRKHQSFASLAFGEFLAQMASNAENASIWWRHHGKTMSNQSSYRVNVFHVHISQANSWTRFRIEISDSPG